MDKEEPMKVTGSLHNTESIVAFFNEKFKRLVNADNSFPSEVRQLVYNFPGVAQVPYNALSDIYRAFPNICEYVAEKQELHNFIQRLLKEGATSAVIPMGLAEMMKKMGNDMRTLSANEAAAAKPLSFGNIEEVLQASAQKLRVNLSLFIMTAESKRIREKTVAYDRSTLSLAFLIDQGKDLYLLYSRDWFITIYQHVHEAFSEQYNRICQALEKSKIYESPSIIGNVLATVQKIVVELCEQATTTAASPKKTNSTAESKAVSQKSNVSAPIPQDNAASHCCDCDKPIYYKYSEPHKVCGGCIHITCKNNCGDKCKKIREKKAIIIK